MKGNQDVIDALNAGLTIELTAINQYFICSKMCADWGLNKLAKHFYDESIEEMKHATTEAEWKVIAKYQLKKLNPRVVSQEGVGRLYQ